MCVGDAVVWLNIKMEIGRVMLFYAVGEEFIWVKLVCVVMQKIVVGVTC